MKRYIRYAIRLYKTYILKDKFLLAHKKWVKDKGDDSLRLDYNLNESSIVFDVGGYRGEFAEKIHKRYKSNIYIFEPVKSFYNIIDSKFSNVNKIKFFNFGLSNKNQEIEISLDNDGSSIHGLGKEKETISLCSVIEFIEKNKINKIDLFKINIEGGEFEVLPALIEAAFVKNIENIQIQFHDFIPNAIEMRDKIRKELSKTHELTYDYYFIWENWKLK